MNRLSVLDFCAGEVYSYILTEQQLEMEQEELLDELGHRSKDCQWMYH